MTDELSTVLARVAAGELTPDEALALLGPPARPADDAPPTEALPPPPPGAYDPRWQPPTPGRDDPVRRILLRTPSRSIQIWGDPSVTEVSVSGAHELHREGTDLVIENPSHGFPVAGRFNIAAIARAIPVSNDNLVVRVNPELALDVDVAAASIKVNGMRGDLRFHLLASALKLDRTVGSVDIDAISSSVKGGLVLNRPSRIDCESSSVKVALYEGSDVTVQARNRMGKVIVPGSKTRGSIAEPDLVEARFGAGTHPLTIDAVMSSVILGPDPTAAGLRSGEAHR